MTPVMGRVGRPGVQPDDMKRTLGCLLTLAAMTTGCASASVVYREPTGGQLALNGERSRAWDDAMARMDAHCGKAGYRIVREENVTVGETTQAQAQTQYHRSHTQGWAQSTTTPVTQYRVTYVCGS